MTRLAPTSIVLHASGSGGPVVLLHCLGVDHHFWDFASELEGEFRLLRYDLPGHGATPVPDAPYTIEDLSHQLAQILKAAGVAKAHVAGISMGGLIAQHFAAGYAAMVDRLILIDTTPRYTDDLRRMWTVRAKTARNEGVKALGTDFCRFGFRRSASPKMHQQSATCATPSRAHQAKATRLPARRLRPPICAPAQARSRRPHWSFAATTIFQASSMPRDGSVII